MANRPEVQQKNKTPQQPNFQPTPACKAPSRINDEHEEAKNGHAISEIDDIPHDTSDNLHIQKRLIQLQYLE